MLPEPDQHRGREVMTKQRSRTTTASNSTKVSRVRLQHANLPAIIVPLHLLAPYRLHRQQLKINSIRQVWLQRHLSVGPLAVLLLWRLL
jgi:hypothetical protein